MQYKAADRVARGAYIRGRYIYEGQITLPDLEFGEEAYAGGHRKSAC